MSDGLVSRLIMEVRACILVLNERGIKITPEQADERARNVAALLLGSYFITEQPPEGETRPTPAQRFADKTDISSGECWLWTGAKSGAGYGQISVNKKAVYAHRFSYEAYFGPIPDGLVIDHLCRNRACVNPFHMEPVTTGENVRRGDSAQASRERAAKITHCPRGHEYNEENTYLYPSASGGTARSCKACWKKRKEQKRDDMRPLSGPYTVDFADPAIGPGYPRRYSTQEELMEATGKPVGHGWSCRCDGCLSFERRSTR